jgi:hypothetical protein
MATSAHLPTEAIARIAELYRNGVMCPMEAWRMIAQVIGEADVDQCLGPLAASDRDTLSLLYKERPDSLVALVEGESSPTEQNAALLAWCGTFTRTAE